GDERLRRAVPALRCERQGAPAADCGGGDDAARIHHERPGLARAARARLPCGLPGAAHGGARRRAVDRLPGRRRPDARPRRPPAPQPGTLSRLRRAPPLGRPLAARRAAARGAATQRAKVTTGCRIRSTTAMRHVTMKTIAEFLIFALLVGAR